MAKKGAGQKHRHVQRQKQQQWEQKMGTKRQSAGAEGEPSKEKPPWWERDVSGTGKK